jgi:hypothetical protein
MNSPQQPQNKKKIVAVSRPLPKLIQDLARMQSTESKKVQLVIDKHGTIVATTLGNKVPEKESKK